MEGKFKRTWKNKKDNDRRGIHFSETGNDREEAEANKRHSKMTWDSSKEKENEQEHGKGN